MTSQPNRPSIRPHPPLEKVRSFWESQPLCTAAVDANLGTAEFFARYDQLREANEPPAFARYLHEYNAFAGKKVLEVGCGNAYTLAKYAEAGARVTGVDLTSAAIEISKKRFSLRGLGGEFMVANAEHLPFESNAFDCICSMGVLHHVPDTVRAIDEIHRCLRPGGRFITMFYHRNSFEYQVLIRLLHLLTRKPLQQLVNEVDGVGNPKGDVYTRRELEELLGQFRDLEIFAGHIAVPKTRFILPSSRTNPLGRRFGWFLYARGRKPAK